MQRRRRHMLCPRALFSSEYVNGNYIDIIEPNDNDDANL